MPSFSLGLAQVEQRLGAVRRRLNLFVLQDALYLSGALIVLATAVVIALALRGGTNLFGGALWASVGAVAAAIAAAALRIRRRWLTAAAMVRYADRRAALDDRLATLLSDPSRTRASHLRDVLLEQILAAAPRWGVDTLAPRRVPRSVFVLLAALAALAVTSFVARPPATPMPSTARRPHPDSRAESSGVAGVRPDTGHTGEQPSAGGIGASAQIAALGGAGGGVAATRSSSAEMPRSDRGGSSTAPQAALRPATDGGDTAHTGAASAGVNDGPRGVTEKVQNAIRQALGSDEAARRERNQGRAGGVERNRTSDLGDQRQGRPGGDPAKNPGASPSTTAGDNARDNAVDQARQPGTSAGQPGAGSAAAPGAPAAQATKGLFGDAPAARAGGRESQGLTLKLGTFAAMNPNEVEPQQQAPPVGNPAVGHGGNREPAPLAEEQTPDAPLQKTDIAPEHEALVRRIFTRDE